MMDWICVKALIAKAKLQEFMTNEDGEVNIVTIVVLIGIAVMLALAFRDQIANLLGKLFGNISDSADKATSSITISTP